MSWESCKKGKLVKEINIDFELIASLKKSAERKSQSARLLAVDKVTVDSVITLLYDSLREILEALAIKHGFKVYNHECYIYFLDFILDEKELAERFDSLRKVRNAINYYGQEVPLQDAQNLIQELAQITSSCRSLLERQLKKQ